MRNTVERFAQLLVVVWSLAALKSADGGSVTWYEPIPVKTVLSAGDDPAPAELKLFEGYPASLSWNFSFTSLNLYSVSIRFDGDAIVISGPGGSGATVMAAFKDKFNFTWISQRLTLVIFNVTSAYDESKGKFSCELATSEGGWIRKIHVKIVERPQIDAVTSDQDVCEHSEVTLSCNATGKPEPNITWTRVWENGTDSGALQSKDGYLVMADISRSFRGTYRCTAFNGIGEPVNKTVKMIVRYSASEVRVFNSSSYVLEGNAHTLSCQATGDPKPNVTWIKVSNNQTTHGNILEFTSIDRNDAGDYKCEASNQCGMEAKTETINVSYPPKITHIMNDTIVNDTDKVTLDCQADGYPSPSIRWIFVSNNSFVPGTFRITGKQEEGFYRCIADNGVGNPATRDVYITVLHYRPLNTTLIINNGVRFVILNQTFIITCDAQANPPATYEIFRDDGHKVGSNSVVTTSVTEVEGKNSVTFKCKASNAYGDGPTAKITVEVYSSSTIYNISLCKIYAKNGEPNDLTCRASGHPAPRITWIFEGTVQESRGFSLTIKPRTNGDRLYTCKAENGIGSPAEGDVHVVVEDKVGQRLNYSMTYLHEEFSRKLNDKEERKYKNLVEVALKVTEAFPECFTPVFELIRFSPNGDRKVVVFFRLLFKRPMGGKASINYLQLEAAKQTWGNVEINSIQYLEDVPDRKRCNTLYDDDQICERPKTVWIVFISCGGTTVVVVIIIIWYRLHKKRNCKDQRVGNCENEDQLALPSNHSTLSEGNPYAGENGGYANSGPLLAVNVDSKQELGAASVDSENTYAKVDKSKKKDKKKDKKAADQKPTEDQYAVVDKSKKKMKKNEPDATYAEVDMSKKSKKPKPGEVLYADLSEFQEMQKMPEVSTSPKTLPPIKLPEAYAETQYADITQFLKGNPEDKRAEPPKESTTSTISNIVTGNKEESSAGNAGDGAETTNETGF